MRIKVRFLAGNLRSLRNYYRIRIFFISILTGEDYMRLSSTVVHFKELPIFPKKNFLTLPPPHTLMFSTVRMNIPMTKDIAAIPRLITSISAKRLQKRRSLATDM